MASNPFEAWQQVIPMGKSAVEEHIQAGADVNCIDPDYGRSPLILAVQAAKTGLGRVQGREVIETLLHKGAHIDHQNTYGDTALLTAAELDMGDIVELLLENRANKDLKNNSGNTPYLAAKNNKAHGAMIPALIPSDTPVLGYSTDLTVHSARNLKAADLNGSSDPYVVCSCGDKDFKTEIVNKDLNPQWEARFSLPPFAMGQECELVLKVWDKDLITDDFLGQVVIFPSPSEVTRFMWFPLTARPGKSDNHITGDLCLSLKTTPIYDI